MKKVIILLALLALPACAKVQGAVQFATTGMANPVTPQMLYDAENAMIVGFAGLNAYKTSCVKGLIAQVCRQNITQIQVYTRQIPAALTTTRQFVKNNDQVNATTAFNTVVTLIADYKAMAQALNIPVEGQ